MQNTVHPRVYGELHLAVGNDARSAVHPRVYGELARPARMVDNHRAVHPRVYGELDAMPGLAEG